LFWWFFLFFCCLGLFFGSAPISQPKTTSTAPSQPSTTDLDLLGDIFSGTGIQQSQFTLPVNKTSLPLSSPTTTHTNPTPIPSNLSSSSPFDALDFSAPPTVSTLPPSLTVSNSNPTALFPTSFPSSLPLPTTTGGVERLAPLVVFQESNLTVTFQSERKFGNAGYLRVLASFTNNSGLEFTEFDFQVAVPMFVELQMEPATGRTLTAQTPVHQYLTLLHRDPDNPKKKLKIRVRMAYKVNGVPTEHTSQIGKFFP